MASRDAARRAFLWGGCLLLGGVLAGCDEGAKLPFLGGGDDEAALEAGTEAGGDTQVTRLVERDIEAPEVFQETEAGLWDGRPSLGGVWVAFPDVKEPERVLIRNEVNKKFVIGALFRRERDNPGPRFQVSSDAAEALGMLAGQPVKLNITALRREEVAETPPAPIATPEAGTASAAATATATATLQAPETIAAASLDAPISLGEDKASASAAPAATAPAAQPAPVASAPAKAAPVKAASSLSKPFIQIGIFSVEQNAENTATSLRGTGILPTVKKQTTKGKTFWRVVVGPATSSAERATLLKKVKGLGFNDAYFVTN